MVHRKLIHYSYSTIQKVIATWKALKSKFCISTSIIWIWSIIQNCIIIVLTYKVVWIHINLLIMKIDYASIFAQVKLETHYFSYLYMTLTFRNWPFVFVYIPQKLWKYRWKFLLAYLYYSHMNISCCNWIYKTAFILIYIINIYNRAFFCL